MIKLNDKIWDVIQTEYNKSCRAQSEKFLSGGFVKESPWLECHVGFMYNWLYLYHIFPTVKYENSDVCTQADHSFIAFYTQIYIILNLRPYKIVSNIMQV